VTSPDAARPAPDLSGLSSVTNEDGSRWYPYPPDPTRMLTSVTTILSGTEGKPHLTPWSAKLAAEYAVDNLSLLAYLKREQGRDAAVNAAKKQAKILRERKADAGSYVHHVIEALIHWHMRLGQSAKAIGIPDLPEHLADVDYDGAPLRDVVDAMVDGFLNFVSDWQPRFVAAEMPVYNAGLGVAGTLDAIVVLSDVALTPDGLLRAGKGTRLVIDVKTGRNLDSTVRSSSPPTGGCPSA